MIAAYENASRIRAAFGKPLPGHRHCVSTATLVEPRTTSLASLNSTKIRLVWGRNDTAPLAVAKMAKVGIALASIVVVTLDPIDEMHWPLIGSVWQRLMLSGNVAAPVVAVAVIDALAPTFTVATAKAFEPVVPLMCRIPSFCAVAANATVSGTGDVDADSSKVLRPVLLGGALTPVQSKPSITIVGANGALGVNAMTKLCEAPAAIDTGVFGEPVSALVAGLVVWYTKLAGTMVTGTTVQPLAADEPLLMMVANAVAVLPTWTDRLDGNTAATSGDASHVRLLRCTNASSDVLPVTRDVWLSPLLGFLFRKSTRNIGVCASKDRQMAAGACPSTPFDPSQRLPSE
jgi:hypothetical protein